MEMQEIDHQLRTISSPTERGPYFPPSGRDRGRPGDYGEERGGGRGGPRGRGGRSGSTRRWGNDRHAANIAGAVSTISFLLLVALGKQSPKALHLVANSGRPTFCDVHTSKC